MLSPLRAKTSATHSGPGRLIAMPVSTTASPLAGTTTGPSGQTARRSAPALPAVARAGIAASGRSRRIITSHSMVFFSFYSTGCRYLPRVNAPSG